MRQLSWQFGRSRYNRHIQTCAEVWQTKRFFSTPHGGLAQKSRRIHGHRERTTARYTDRHCVKDSAGPKSRVNKFGFRSRKLPQAVFPCDFSPNVFTWYRGGASVAVAGCDGASVWCGRFQSRATADGRHRNEHGDPATVFLSGESRARFRVDAIFGTARSARAARRNCEAALSPSGK